MHVRASLLTSSPTDLANFLSCRHKTELDLLTARGRIARPMWKDPLADVLRDRGLEHERRYIDALRAQGLRVVDLTRPNGDRADEATAVEATLAAMRDGADVIVQAPLAGDGWFGYADVLRRVDGASALGAWHYEAHDTKLARETRGGTILQLCVYSHVIGALQGRMPELLHVVTPVASEAYRVDDFAAFYRQLVADYRAFVDARREADGDPSEYPQPNDHCEVCRWWERCNARRRKDDHLSFVAGLGRSHQAEFESRDLATLEKLAVAPLPLAFKPRRGSRETCEKLCEQARVQKQQRDEARPIHELLDIDGDDFGLRLLPAPSTGDVFLDFEGDPFAREGGREYLVGVGRARADGTFEYQAQWAFADDEERALFEWLMDELQTAIKADQGAHIYHYAPYEPAALKRLMARYATREMEVDELLRGQRFIDLYAVLRRSLRAGVESYSIKKMEPFYGFARDIELDRAGDQRRVVEIALETGDLSAVTPEARAAVEGYNRDDCRSTLELRTWLEALRSSVVESGRTVPRPGDAEEAPAEVVKERDRQVADLRARLLARIASDTPATDEERAVQLMAYLIDWHRREDKVVWWEYFRLRDLAEAELEDEPAAVVKLELVTRVDVTLNKKTGKPTGSVVDRYTFPPQEFEIRAGMDLKCQDDTTFGEVVAVDREHRTIDVKKGKKMADVHPSAAFTHDHVNADVLADALLRIGEHIAAHGCEGAGPYAVGRRLLLRQPPCVGGADLASARVTGESEGDFAVRIISNLDHSVLPVQGPPGAGKTFTGARMICDLVKRGRRVGITATGHKVIRNLLDAVALEAADQKLEIRRGQRRGSDEEADPGGVAVYGDNNAPLAALSAGEVDVVGGTAWLWARPEYASAVDVLFVDEAGQMSLANVVAVSQAADSLVLLGDPQQLEQPQKGSHPDGVGVSALEHTLGDHKTMPDDRGIFLPVTWRLAPAICDFTSEVFYEGRLHPRPQSAAQRISGSRRFDGAGLRVVDADHDDCRNASDEEADLVASIVDELLESGVEWTNNKGERAPMTANDILVVAPYNAQVARLADRLERRRVAAGTVDRFQGQEAPVVIYSMATSRPEDAPRGLEFLYNPNRLNVATSRAKCLCILVASPRLFEPECRTPRQMQLANALCRYRELARRT